MATRPHSSTRRKLVILTITALAGVLLVAGAYAGWKTRKAMMVRQALADGTAAYDRSDWETAGRMLARYLSVHQDNAAILAKYARAQLSIRPLPPENVRQAMGAYRQILRLDPTDAPAFRRLVQLYETTGAFSELEYVARNRLEAVPDDPQAILVEARALLYRQKPADAEQKLEALIENLTERTEKCPGFVEACILLVGLAADDVPVGGDATSEARALQWLDRAIEYSPDAALPRVQRAAIRRGLAERARRELSAADRTAIAEDLQAAEELDLSDPRARLGLIGEWIAQRAFDRAAAQLDAARQLDPETSTGYFVDPQDWAVGLFRLAAAHALVTGAREEGVALAEGMLERLRERPQRVDLLPLVIELLVAGGRTAEARERLSEFTEAVKLRTPPGSAAEQVAFLEAVLARAEDRPYVVIEQLEPLADKSGTPPLVRALLADAYARTGQTSRMIKAMGKDAADARLTVEQARRLAIAHLQAGEWDRARDALRSFSTSVADDVDTHVLRLAAEVGQAVGQTLPNPSLDALDSALAALRTRHPQRLDIRALRAMIAEARGQRDAAEAELRRAVDECEPPLRALLALARFYSSNQRTEDALTTLRSACERHGTGAQPWLALADLLVAQRRIEEARAELQRAPATLTERAEQRQVAERLAVLEIAHGNTDAGMTSLRELAAADPHDTRVRGLLLEVPGILKDTREAQRLVGEIKRIEGNTGVLWRLHEARLWLAGRGWQSRSKEIETLLRYCIDADPRWTAPVMVLGGMYEQLGELADAEMVYANGFRLGGTIEAADRLLALLQRQKRFADARDLLKRLEQRLSEQAVGARRVALAVSEGQYGEAIHELELRIAGAEKDPVDLVRLAGLSYAQRKDAQRALALLAEAASLGAEPIAVARMQAWILKEEKRFDEAAGVLDEFVARQQTPEAYLLRASYHASVGQDELAERDYRELARVAKDDFGAAALGESYARAGKLDQAIDTWEEGLRAYPESTLLRRGLTKALLMRRGPGDAERAEEVLNELEAVLPDDTDLLWVRAVERLGKGTRAAEREARAALKRATTTPTADMQVYQGLARTALQLGDAGTARDLAGRGLQFYPGDSSLMLHRAQAELALKAPEAAGDLARVVLATGERNVGALEVLLEAAAGRRDKATLRNGLTTAQDWLKNEPTSDRLHALRARIWLALGQPDAAIAALQEFQASDAGRQSVPTLLLLSDTLRAKGDLTAARRYLDEAAALVADDEDVRRSRLLLLAAEKQFDEVAALASATNPVGHRPTTLLTAATILASSAAHLDTAIRLCERAVEAAPDQATAYATLGDLKYQKGDAAGAEQAYRAALERDAVQAEALNNLAWVLAEARGAYEEGLPYARKAAALRPADANFRDTVGVILRNIPGRLNEARDELRKSVELAPRGSALRARSLLHLAQVCAQLNDRPAVQDSLKEALRVDGAEPVFTPGERAEIERLMQAAGRTE